MRRNLRDFRHEVRGYFAWRKRRFAAPAPAIVKRQVLLRNGVPGAPWIETGTFKGDTTAFLVKHFPSVVSLEPSVELFEQVRARFAGDGRVQLINDVSENVFPTLLPTLGGNLNFWLDGHYSAGETFQGERDTPIVEELHAIEENLTLFRQVAVLIDDVRCFDPGVPEYSGYPSRRALVDWAERNALAWSIEHDIFVAVK